TADALAVEKFDLTLAMFERDGVFQGELSFDVALFDRTTMERFVRHFVSLASAALAAPETRLAALPLLSEDERRTLLVAWNATERVLPPNLAVYALFQAQVARSPEAVAVEHEGSRLTYRELQARAERVASWLLARGVHPGDRVAVEVTRSELMVAAVLGVMR